MILVCDSVVCFYSREKLTRSLFSLFSLVAFPSSRAVANYLMFTIDCIPKIIAMRRRQFFVSRGGSGMKGTAVRYP